MDLVTRDPAQLYASSIPLEHIFFAESALSVLKPPVWPERILGEIDQQAAALGRYLFEEKTFDSALPAGREQWCPPPSEASQPCPNPNRPRKGLCARCHAPVAETEANQYGKRYLQLPLYKLDVIGTDPLDAINFNARQVYTGNLRKQFGGRERVGIGEALLTTTSGIMAREFDGHSISSEDAPVMTGYRKNEFRAPLAYPARPLEGAWAAPPYLHNGSVPNLYQLLSPANERSASFWTGNREFDPRNVGYRSDEFPGGFEFRVRRNLAGAVTNSLSELFVGRLGFQRDIDGNSNLGHEFRDAPPGTKGVIGPYLSPQERLAIIEYMKAMPVLPAIDYAGQQAVLKELEQEFGNYRPR